MIPHTSIPHTSGLWMAIISSLLNTLLIPTYSMSRFLFLFALAFPLIIGCDGCRSNRDQAEKDKDETPVDAFTSLPASVFPGDQQPLGGGIKPGHWFSASQSLKSNRDDVRGTLESHVRKSNSAQAGKDVNIDLVSLRPVTLPKGQQRRSDVRVLAPNRLSESRTMFLSSQLYSSGNALVHQTGAAPFRTLAPEEYFFVILTTRPGRFAKLQTADWQRPIRGEDEFETHAANYRIVIPKSDELLPLSETMLDWTSTAVIFWDDIPAEAFTPGQIKAIGDWLHFGGQIIVNGADACEAIADSPLGDYLPMTPTGNIELDPDAGRELLENWGVASDLSTSAQAELLKSQSGRIAIDGRVARDTASLENSGSLILDRPVGRGRMVLARFDLLGDWMTNWGSYQSFFNSVMLNRPRRKFIRLPESVTPKQQYADFNSLDAHPTMNSKFRIASRDSRWIIPTLSAAREDENSQSKGTLDPIAGGADPYTRSDPAMGTSSWGQHSDVLHAAQTILKNESGIEIPPSSLVIRSLGYYLLALVPLNYLIFRLMGRLELAWIAVPVIALAGAIWVARSAQLDIGFARSQTELAILETQPGYSRGHLTRVVAIYNSLSSSYDIQFKTVDAVADSISVSNRDDERQRLKFKTDFEEGPILAGVSVASNQTQMVRAEQIVDLGGGIYRSGDELVNETEHELLDVFVVEKPVGEQAVMRVAAVGSLTSGEKATLRFREEPPVISSELPLQLTGMFERFIDGVNVPSGSSRMVARIEQSLDGMAIVPKASQVNAQTVVLANLKHAPIPKPQPDENLISDLMETIKE